MTPIATYRLQMHAGFNLAAATAIIPYLHSLGISHVYTSSLLTAKPGSLHGYDVTDHSRLNPEIGTDAELLHFSSELKARGMGLILDVVPNHMSVGGENAWWFDVLENGPSSPYAFYFDIAWNDHHRDALRGKVLLPILGTTYGEALDSGQFRLAFDAGLFFLHFFERRLPVDPRTYGLILDPVLAAVKSAEAPLTPGTLELQSILTAIKHLPSRTEADPVRIIEGRGEIGVIKRRLAEWAASNAAGATFLNGYLTAFATDPVALDRLIEAQAYRPCYWRVASDEINYRRFFDVNDLAALSTERPEVFDDLHRLIFDWIDAGIVDGLRIDHPDGLYQPRQYLERLQHRGRHDGEHPPVYVVVEKILGPREQLRADWPCNGTTGYEFLNIVNALFIDPDGEAALTSLYNDFTGWDQPFAEMVYRKKFLILQSSLTSELHVLAGHFDRLAQSDRSSRDFTLNSLRHALREVLCCFGIYRTYIHDEASDQDQIAVKRAVRQARRRNPLLGKAIFDFLRDTLLLRDPPSGPASSEYRTQQQKCSGRFQQLCAPVMAKGYEDTALYNYHRLISLNEVGSDATAFGRSPAEVHAFLQQRSDGLSPLSTHDTKRGEDVRARINVLSEVPSEWAERVRHWPALNAPLRTVLDDESHIPDRNEEYLLYQTLVGTWPDDVTPEYVTRIREYLTKAIQEAKVHSSWINPDAEYLKAIGQFVDSILDAATSAEFIADVRQFVDRIRPHGYLNSLGQTLLRCTAPGVPDTYQGTERWDFRLVDPDNRGPVQFEQSIADLAADSTAWDWFKHLSDPRSKLLLTARALRFRSAHAALFESGTYRSLKVEGPHASHLFACLREHQGQRLIVLVPRLSVRLYDGVPIAANADVWGDTRVEWPQERCEWGNLLTGQPVSPSGEWLLVRDLLSVCPLAMFAPR